MYSLEVVVWFQAGSMRYSWRGVCDGRTTMNIKKKLAAYLEDSFFYRLRKIGFEKNDEDGANGSYHRVTGDLIHGIALDFINLERILVHTCIDVPNVWSSNQPDARKFRLRHGRLPNAESVFSYADLSEDDLDIFELEVLWDRFESSGLEFLEKYQSLTDFGNIVPGDLNLTHPFLPMLGSRKSLALFYSRINVVQGDLDHAKVLARAGKIFDGNACGCGGT